MPSGKVEEIIPASAERVFDLVHDYERRLEWDTLLREAYIEPPYIAAGEDVVTVCKGRWLVGGIAMRTVYVSFRPGRTAAVRLLDPVSFFETFAASIRHFDIEDGSSTVSYQFNFTSRPHFLRPLIDPLMLLVLKAETRKRLRSLRRHFLA